MANLIEVKNLHHSFGKKLIYKDLNFSVKEGEVFGILGRNGVGKSTLINILTGFLQPTSGECRIFGENSHELSAQTRAKIGLLYEGHLTFDFLTIKQIESFYSAFYKKLDAKLFWELTDLLGLKDSHKIKNMSYGQRAQVVLGLIMASNPQLIILDDYSLGLDAGYRRLFLNFLKDYIKKDDKTVVITSHIVNDLESIMDNILLLEKNAKYIQTSLENFLNDLHCFSFAKPPALAKPTLAKILAGTKELKSFEIRDDECLIFTYLPPEKAQETLCAQGLDLGAQNLQSRPMRLEDAFVGYTGMNV